MIILYIWLTGMLISGILIGFFKYPEFDYEWIVAIPAVIFWPIALLIIIGTSPLWLGKIIRRVYIQKRGKYEKTN